MSSIPTAEEIILWEFKGSHNPFSPEIVEVGKVGFFKAYELSKGKGMNGRPLWAVSIAEYYPETQTTDRIYDESKAGFESEAAVRRYLIQLREDYYDEEDM